MSETSQTPGEAKLPLIVITGPTASGKTGLAIQLAQQFGGEIICADSRTIYEGADKGTAKPTAKEQQCIPHWGLDIIVPGESFSAANFKIYAQQKIREIRQRGNIPFLVGGTGLYVDAVVFDYQFGPAADVEQRKRLNNMTLNELYEYCSKNNVELPENHKNKRYVIRAIESKSSQPLVKSLPISTSIIVGIATDREVLRARIVRRSEQLFEDGVVEEATILGKKYGWENAAMSGNVYPLVRRHLTGSMTFEEMKVKNATLDWRLAKRQMTWMRRNKFITWLSLEEAHTYLAQRLAIKD